VLQSYATYVAYCYNRSMSSKRLWEEEGLMAKGQSARIYEP